MLGRIRGHYFAARESVNAWKTKPIALNCLKSFESHSTQRSSTSHLVSGLASSPHPDYLGDCAALSKRNRQLESLDAGNR